jgi:non-ribosomal peptide synthase protein (TIGR01720 family)
LPANSTPTTALKTIKEQLRQVPNQGIGLGILRYLGEETAVSQLATLPKPPISFNYLGQYDQALPADAPFAPATESTGPDRSPNAERSHPIDITGSVNRGKLHITWDYSPHQSHSATIQRLADNYLAALRDLIAACSQPDSSGATPSDFPLAQLNQKKLDKLMAKMKRS